MIDATRRGLYASPLFTDTEVANMTDDEVRNYDHLVASAPAVEPEDWEGCAYPYPEHDWTPGDLECRRCGADLSQWNDQ